MSINEKVVSLVSEIKNTNEYKILIKTRGVIDKNSTLKNKLLDFNKKQSETFDKSISSKDFEAKAKLLDETYSGLLKIQEINNFLAASKNFDDLMASIFKDLNDSVYS